ncbi:LapB repeat-containing protein, partial [Listeria booriae]
INGGSVSDITGIDYAHNLTSVRIANTQVTDFSLLASLPKLTNISLAGNNITSNSIPNLNNLQNLSNLSISPASLDNSALTKINKIPNLTFLDLDSNYSLTDIMPLQSLPNLATLFVQFCGIHDYRGIENFPKLNNLSAYGQNVGRTVLINSTIKSSALNYNEAAQTIFVPFTLMTDRTVNFNGDLIPFSTSTSSSNTYFTLNEQQINGSRLSIDNTGITVTGITKDFFDSITKMEYNSVYNNPAGSYATPPNITNYSISGGTYDHYFDIDHSLTITNDAAISYTEGNTITETQFLTDINAETDDGTPVTSDFNSVVDLNTPGVYTVTLNAENSA